MSEKIIIKRFTLTIDIGSKSGKRKGGRDETMRKGKKKNKKRRIKEEERGGEDTIRLLSIS